MPWPLRMKGHDLRSQVVDCTSCFVCPLVDLEGFHVHWWVPRLGSLGLFVRLVVAHDCHLLLVGEVAVRPKESWPFVQLMGSHMFDLSNFAPPIMNNDGSPDASILHLGQCLWVWPTCHSGHYTCIVTDDFDTTGGLGSYLRGCCCCHNLRAGSSLREVRPDWS